MSPLLWMIPLLAGTSPRASACCFSDIDISPLFESYLLADRLLMEVTGAKIICAADGTEVVISVASTVLKNISPSERLRAERVCRVKALANLAAEKEGVHVFHVQTVEEHTTTVVEDGRETATSVSELLEITTAQCEGIVKDMPVIGRWKSNDGAVYYLAIGAILDQDSHAVMDPSRTARAAD